MNYRHAFHAGNFADVVKHALLARLILHLTGKDAPFRLIETHAGAGLYDLKGPEAERTGEWHDGIGRLIGARLTPDVASLLAPFLDLAAPLVADGAYPGSPILAQRLTRPIDRLVFCEARAETAATLADALGRDPRCTIVADDGYRALPPRLPPPERRGLILIDPPYERRDEAAAVTATLAAALKRFATGVLAVWYPIKGRHEADALVRRVAGLEPRKLLRIELGRYRVERVDRLNGCGLMIINAPWRFDAECRVLLPALAAILALEGDGRSRVEVMAGA